MIAKLFERWRRERRIKRISACAYEIQEKWLYFNDVLKFKPETTFDDILFSFFQLILVRVSQKYPDLLSPRGGTIFELILIALISIPEMDKDELAKALASVAIRVGIEPERVLV